MDMQGAIKAVTEGRSLSSTEMTDVMRTIMTGAATPAQIGGFLIGLRMKGETIEEIAGAADAANGVTEMEALIAYLQGLGTARSGR